MLPYAPWIVWMFPLLMAFTHFIWERISKRLRDFLAVGTGFVSAIFAASMIPDILNGYVVVDGVRHDVPFDWVGVNWIPIPGLSIKLGVLVDPLSVLMANIVAWISSLIFLYSVEYLHGDRGITRYWMLVNFFIGAMELLVISDNFLMMFFGWEGVGLASYALIGYWYEDRKEYWIDIYPPSHCGMKAFVTTRVGDVGLLISIVILFLYSGTFNYVDLASNAGWLASMAKDGILFFTLVLMFFGPIGKSAQFPLHVWLPEAMAGPTTVSALIHAATMVKAGVYLIARLDLVLYAANIVSKGVAFTELHEFFLVVAWIGAFTAFLAASMGMVANQIKKVLAYSTVSQLGYMFAALGAAGLLMEHGEAFVDSFLAGISHLFSHAIFKALLFLSAGAIGHAIESYMLKDMGGLKKYMPKTFMVMLAGALSLSGVPPFNGFWSKDSILHGLMAEGLYTLYIVLAITAIMTVFYTFRMMGLAFFGSESSHVKHLIEEGHKPHDPGIYMMIPLWVLAVGSVISGFLIPSMAGLFTPSFNALGLPGEALAEVAFFNFNRFVIGTVASVSMPIALGIILVGFLPAYYGFISYKFDVERLVEESPLLRAIWTFLFNRWYINAFYYKFFVNGTLWFSRVIFNNVEANGVGLAIKSGYSTLSNVVRKLQTGILRMNMVYIALGILLILYLIMVSL